MRIVVSSEHRFDRTPDGAVWTQAVCAHRFWSRYLEVFDEVRVVARVREVGSPPQRHIRADGPGVRFTAIPYFIGPWQYLRRSGAVRNSVLAAVSPADAVLMRVGSQLANCLFPELRRQQRPFALEVVSDPWDVFAPGSIRHPLRPWFRLYFTRQLREQCQQAAGAAYVTQHTLQTRYPVCSGGFTAAYSSVELPEAAIRSHPPQVRVAPRRFRLVFVGSLAQMYKGLDVLLQAIAICSGSGLELELRVIGDGRFRPRLESQCRGLGIRDRVDFLGQLPAGDSIRVQMDQADLFVLPSRCEGLPRALIEAMARGLPCVASTAGGIPELLPADELVTPGDPGGLARQIRQVLVDPQRRQQMAIRNLARARDYHEQLLRARQREFYAQLRACTGSWQSRAA